MLSLIRIINNSQLKDEKAKIYKLAERKPKKDAAKIIKFPSKTERDNRKNVAAEKKQKIGTEKKIIQQEQKINKTKSIAPERSIATRNANVKGGAGGGKMGMKRKGRLPSKVITNKLGNLQTVYYRPDKKTKSKYINPALQSTGDLMRQYKDSFKRMLFLDHGDRSNQVRGKGNANQAWGHDMGNKLDKLADKYGFNDKNFDQAQDKLTKDFKGLDNFLQEAENMYGELYKTGDRHPHEFLQKIFHVTELKLHTRYNRKGVENALQQQGLVPWADAQGKKLHKEINRKAVENVLAKPNVNVAQKGGPVGKAEILAEKTPAKPSSTAFNKALNDVAAKNKQARLDKANVAPDNAPNKDPKKVSEDRNIKSVINDPVLVKKAKDFLKRFKFS